MYQKKKVSVYSTGHDLDASFFNTHSDFQMEKTEIAGPSFLKTS